VIDFCMSLCGIPQYGGKYVVNPSGGLEAKGHPLGATGLGMHFYITSKSYHFSTGIFLMLSGSSATAGL